MQVIITAASQCKCYWIVSWTFQSFTENFWFLFVICRCWFFSRVWNQKINLQDATDVQWKEYIAGFYVFRIGLGKIKVYWAEIQTILFEAEHTVNIFKIRYIRFCSELFQITVLLPRALLYSYTIRPILKVHLLGLYSYFCSNFRLLSTGADKARGWIYCTLEGHHRNRPQTATRDPRWHCFLSWPGKLQLCTT